MSADVTTMVGTWPSCSVMTRPYFLDNSARRRWGRVFLEESKWRLPIMGSFRGPGGNFDGCFCMDFMT